MKAFIQFFALSLLLTMAACGSSQPEKNQTAQDGELTVMNDGLDLAVNSMGSGEYTLLFVHGWNINSSYWSQQVEHFKENYRVVTLDLAGFGKSGKNRENWTIEHYASDVNAVINSLEMEKVILIGHSMAGEIVLEAALNNDEVLAIIGIDNFKELTSGDDVQSTAEIATFFQYLEQQYTATVSFFTEANLFHNNTPLPVRERVMNDFINADSVIATKALKGLNAYAQKEAVKLSQLKQTLYLINSNATPTDTVSLSQTGASYQLIEIDSTGHYPMIEKPELFNQLLDQSLNDITSSVIIK